MKPQAIAGYKHVAFLDSENKREQEQMDFKTAKQIDDEVERIFSTAKPSRQRELEIRE